MRTYIKAYMSLKFGQIPPLTTELAALERLKNRSHHVISVDIDPIFFKLAGNKNMHNIMNEFEFRTDRTTDYGVSCPWASKKYPYRPYNRENGVSTFSLLFFNCNYVSISEWDWDVQPQPILSSLLFVLRFYNPVNTPNWFDASLCTLTAIHMCMKHHEGQTIKYWSRLQNLFGPDQIFTVWTKFGFVNSTQNLVQT